MRLWFVLAQTLFRSTSADLVAARSRDGEDAAAVQANTGEAGGEGAPAAPSAGQARRAGGAASPAAEKKAAGSKRVPAAQRAVMAERENVRQVMEARRRTERSSVGFWWRWRAAMTRHRLLSAAADAAPPSLLGWYAQLPTSVAGDGAPRTAFLRSLTEAYPVVCSEGAALAGALFFPHAPPARGAEGGAEEPSLAVLDARLREAWQQYDLRCVQPAIAAAAPGSSEGSTAASSAARGTSGPPQPLPPPPPPRWRQKGVVQPAPLVTGATPSPPTSTQGPRRKPLPPPPPPQQQQQQPSKRTL
ncbi:uncharacterized protein Tco025E_05636 [Trypanosoma conorhini]|uniref:Uncharacterized protein n=1 Tax=Trypanosoma conorhini TaxID=83891 RepID=A0A3R7L2R1_9TRYP|nr:uncharacterized protein Tco025E_05636 [Trypanosoma conorhini]RNF15187.1 hypothetical protein Tco025E_05636 [Trypanosoma conorhini]